jgi:hypothetical protein
VLIAIHEDMSALNNALEELKSYVARKDINIGQLPDISDGQTSLPSPVIGDRV